MSVNVQNIHIPICIHILHTHKLSIYYIHPKTKFLNKLYINTNLTHQNSNYAIIAIIKPG